MKQIFLFCGFLVLILLSQTATSQNISKVYHKYSQLAPRLEPDLDDEIIYVVSFFATWCVQCRKEIPEMVKLDKKYRNNKNVKVLFVNLDDASRQRKVRPFLKKHKITGEVVCLTDPNQEKWIAAIHRNWNGALPGTLFIKGFNRKFYNYPMTFEELERNIGFLKNK